MVKIPILSSLSAFCEDCPCGNYRYNAPLLWLAFSTVSVFWLFIHISPAQFIIHAKLPLASIYIVLKPV
jgi:hypothetical protein